MFLPGSSDFHATSASLAEVYRMVGGESVFVQSFKRFFCAAFPEKITRTLFNIFVIDRMFFPLLYSLDFS
jgi:hypothetical protein